MSKANVCYWVGPEKAWADMIPDTQYYYGDNLITVVDKSDTQITIRYESPEYDGKTRKMSKNQALKFLQR